MITIIGGFWILFCFLDYGTEAVAYARSRLRDESLQDFTGSKLHRHVLDQTAGEEDVFCLVLVGHVDPAPMQQSTCLSFTPLQFTVSELPPALRMSMDCVLLYRYGITKTVREADFSKLCAALDRKLQQIDGLTVTVGDRVLPVRVRLAVIVADLPAKAKLMGMNSHTGYYGCNCCVAKGIWEDHRMLYPDSEVSQERTPRHYRLQYNEAVHNRRDSYGFKV